MSPRLSVLRWLRILACVAASRHRWLPQSPCRDPECPRCRRHVAQEAEGEALYREWLEAEKELGER